MANSLVNRVNDAVRLSEVQQSLDGLVQHISALEDTLNSLTSRIQRVVRPLEQPPCDKKPEPSFGTSLATDILNQSLRIRKLNEEMTALVSLIEL